MWQSRGRMRPGGSQREWGWWGGGCVPRWARRRPCLSVLALSPMASASLVQPSLPITGGPQVCQSRGPCPCWGGQAHPHCPASSLLHPAAFGALRDAPHGLATGRYRQPSDGAGSHQTVPGAAHLPSPQSARGAVQLRGRASELEAELAEQRHLKQQAQDESEFLRAELEELKKQREDTEKAQRSLTEIESERGEPAPSLGWG